MLKSKFALLAATAIVSGMLAVPAFADVNVTANIRKDKDVFVSVDVNILKDIEIDVTMADVAADGLAEAEAFINADTSNNSVRLELRNDTDGEGLAIGSVTKRLATMSDAVNGNTGVIMQFNQDVGDNVNQGNVVSIAAVDVVNAPGGEFDYAVTHAEAATSQRSSRNDVEFRGSLPAITGEPLGLDGDSFHVRAEISDVMEENIGVVMGNQNAGQNANQHNSMALALGLDSGLALAEGDLGQESSFNNRTLDFLSFKRAQIDSSINNNSGVTAFNQNTGHNNNQGTVISIAATGVAGNLNPGPVVPGAATP